MHPGGVVITPRPIDEYVPVERAPKGVPIIQWEKDAAEDAGLVKIDLLGNRSLAVIRDALANLRENGAAVSTSPAGSPRTTSPPRRPWPRAAPWGASTSRARPCASCSRSRGWATSSTSSSTAASSGRRPTSTSASTSAACTAAPWTPLHPLLTEVLAETYGIMVYQEDVSRVAMALAGFSHAEADGLRKILSKKDRELQLPDYPGASGRAPGRSGVADEQIAAVWDMILSFDGYSFCKPHSASYARVSFQAALPQGPPPGRVHGRGDQQPGRVLQRLRLRLGGPAPGP